MFATTKSAKRARKEEDQLAFLNQNVEAENSTLYPLRATMVENILFARGVHYARFNTQTGKFAPTRDSESRRVRVVANITDPIVEGIKAIYLASTPKRSCIPLGDDDAIIESADFASDLLDWQDEMLNTEETTINLIDYLVECGSAFKFVGWDPSGGRQFETDQGPVREGDPFEQVVSPLEISFHPQVSDFYASPYVRRVTLETRDWLETYHPEKAKELASFTSSDGAQNVSYQKELANLQVTHARYSIGGSVKLEDSAECWVKMEYFHLPCPKYPQGLYAIAAVSGEYARKILHIGPLPYGQLPFVMFRHKTAPGMAWGASIIPNLKPQQREINRRLGQLIEIGNRVANQKLFVPMPIDIEQVEASNAPGHAVPVPAGSEPCYYAQPPAVHDSVVTSIQYSLQMLNYIASPVGPLVDDQATQVRSGVHQAMIEEMRNRKVAPSLRAWELAHNRVCRLRLRNWHRFQKLDRKIGVVRKDGNYTSRTFTDMMQLDQVQVKIVPYSSLPFSRTASLAEAVELTKVGLLDPVNDTDEKYSILDSVLRSNSSTRRLNRSLTADFDKARRNLHYIRHNNLPEVDITMVDNATVHRSVYEEWTKTEEYHEWKKSPENSQADQTLWSLITVFGQLELQNQLALAGQNQKMNGAGASAGSPWGPSPNAQGPNGPQGVQAQAKQISPGNPMGGNRTRSQGMSQSSQGRAAPGASDQAGSGGSGGE